MKKLIVRFMVLGSFLGIFGCSSNPADWSDAKVDAWFNKGEWLNGWNVKPDASVNKREFAVSYFKNKERWDKAFTFLKSNDLMKLEIKRYEIDGDNAYAPVSEYMTKEPEAAKFEAHRKYIDIQYIIDGEEQMGLAPLSKQKTILTPYDATKDVEFSTVTDSSLYVATPNNFFIFFPSDVHRPSVKVTESSHVKKIVVKVKVD
jgi:YhcH/YjgK/YiaL family protein